MRRGINIRKKKKIMLKQINSKALKLLIALIFFLAILCIAYIFFIQNIFIKNDLEKESVNFSNLNDNIPYSIRKIILFCSANAETSSKNQSLSLDISQYCDIGIYLNNMDKENTFIESLYINNISLTTPEIGKPFLYKKSINDLGKCSFTEEAIIENELFFNIIDRNNTINFDNYELLNDGSSPISLGFYNKNIKQGFITDSSEIVYNGTLLKEAFIPQSSLNCVVSFTINIITTEGSHYLCNISFDIPFEDEEGSLYDTGYVTKEFNNNETNKFIRIK